MDSATDGAVFRELVYLHIYSYVSCHFYYLLCDVCGDADRVFSHVSGYFCGLLHYVGGLLAGVLRHARYFFPP